MTEILKLYFSRGGVSPPPFFHPLNLLFSNPIEFIKIYIGQLPLDFEEYQLKEILQPMAELKEVKIMKGDSARGRFDLFCYAFVTMKGNEAFGFDIIHQLQERYPNWKMNIKYDNDRMKMQRGLRNYQNPNMPYAEQQPNPYQPYPPQMQRQPFNYYYPPQNNQFNSNLQPNAAEKIVGQKPCNVLVRELWLGGIPENCDKSYMSQLMSYYGIIEQIEIFPKFAFIKYKQAAEATVAFERAEQIAQRLGNPRGFRMVFSDPSRRAYIVSNNYEYDRQSPSLPILFIGFPPITSANVDLTVIKPVCQKFGPILNEYMRKNVNTQNRSYFLFTFDNIKNALRAKQQLSKRKDLLGDKRAEVALLLDQSIILKGHDLSHTEKLYQGDGQRGRKSTPHYAMDNNMQGGMMPMQMGYPMYQNNNMYPPQNPYAPPSYYPPQQPQYYYDPSYYKNPAEQPGLYPNVPEQAVHPNIDSNIHQFLKDVLADKDTGGEKKPIKSGQTGKEEDILSKLLGHEVASIHEQKEDKSSVNKDKSDEREPSWSGFLTWKGMKRVGVDGHSSAIQPEDYAINILSLIEFKDLVIKDRNVMVLEASNSTGAAVFKEYVKQLRAKVGVAMNSQYLMYVMAKSEHSDQVEVINDDELLVVLEKASFLTQIKDKLVKCEELP